MTRKTSHVTRETATVYRIRGRRYFTRQGAYYGAAKAMVKAKYPAYDNDEVYDNAPEGRWEKRLDLFYQCGEKWAPNGHEPSQEDYFDPDKWTAFIQRVARFLRFVDSKKS